MMGTMTRALAAIGLLALTGSAAQAQWYRYESDRLRHMDEARTSPRAPRSQLTRDQYLVLERDRQERWLDSVQRRQERQALQLMVQQERTLESQQRAASQLHERQLQVDAEEQRTQRHVNRLTLEERLQRERQQHELRLQERQHRHELRRNGVDPLAPPPIDYRGHGS